MSPTSLYLPSEMPWFKDLLLEINSTKSISSYLFRLAAEDLYSRKKLRQGAYLEVQDEINKSMKPRPAKLSGEFKSFKLYVKEEYAPILKAIEALNISRSAYFWTLVIKDSKLKLTKAQIKQFRDKYPKEFQEVCPEIIAA